MKRISAVILVAMLTLSLMCTSAFAGTGNTVTFNGGHIYEFEAGKPGTIQMEITNISSQSKVTMDDKELLTFIDDVATAERVLYVDGDGNEISIKSVVSELNSNGGVPVYYAESAPVVITAKQAMSRFITSWKGTEKKSTFTGKYYNFEEYSNSNSPILYDAQPKARWIMAPGTSITLEKSGKYIFALNDDGSISGSPMSVFCVIVGGAEAEPAFVSKVSLNKTAVTLAKGKTCVLKATIAPSTAAVKSVNWTSSNPKVAKVDKNGKVKALGKGKATITATTIDGSDVKTTCVVTVK